MENVGKISEWNEATLKVIRLHEIQATINLLKLDPLNRTENKFNYELLANSVRLLYGEGYSKYTPKEREEVDRIENLAFNLLKHYPPHEIIIQQRMSGQIKSHKINRKNYELLMSVIEFFERKVKDLNDEHGLTTRNIGEQGLF